MKTKKSVALLCACLVGVLGMVAGPAWAEPLSIVGFETGGGMAFEGATVSNYYTLEFAPTLLGPWTNWGSVCSQSITGTVMSLPSPFFYRIRQTDNSAFPPYAPASNIPGYMLANGAVTGDKIAAGTVDAGNLAASVSNAFVLKSGDTMNGALALALPGGTAIQALGVDVNTFGTPENAKASSYLRLRDMGAGTTFRVRGDGYVGIGTGDPAERLEVAGRILLNGGNANLGFGNDLSYLKETGRMLLGWNRSGGAGEADFISNRGGGGSDGGFYFYDVDNAGTETKLLSIGGTGQAWIRDNLLVNGNIGIGTVNPQGGLHIRSAPAWSSWNIGPDLIVDGIRNNGIALLDAASSNPWSIYNAAGTLTLAQMPPLGDVMTPGTVRFAISSNGCVGIGEEFPHEPLEVAGRILLNGDKGNLYGVDLAFLTWSAKLLLGRNQSGLGEADFIQNRGNGDTGGFAFFDMANNFTLNRLMTMKGDGTVGIGTTNTSGGMLTVAGDVKASGFIGNGEGLTNISAAGVSGVWKIGGNEMGPFPPIICLGPTDANYLELRVQNKRAMILQTYGTNKNMTITGGNPANYVLPGIEGATIAGGGTSDGPNAIEKNFGTISGGLTNRVKGFGGVIGGGQNNVVNGDNATIGGGFDNHAGEYYATVAGGGANSAGSYGASIGGGWHNTATGNYATVGGGLDNAAKGPEAFVGGGATNLGYGQCATVAGGESNRAFEAYSTVGGGWRNTATSTYSLVCGGLANTAANGIAATVCGGGYNLASGQSATVGGGNHNTADFTDATVCGGCSNRASGYAAAIGGGYHNSAYFIQTTIGGGGYNVASNDNATVSGGEDNKADGKEATVPGGHLNEAHGTTSFAAGYNAKANHDGSFVWGDLTSGSVGSIGPNSFTVRCYGGAQFWTADATGPHLDAGDHQWEETSDRNLKENFIPVDVRDVLDRLSRIPVTEWNLKSQDPSIRHMGPMAQDFYVAFKLGKDDKSIGTLDASGVSMAAIQGLYQVLKEQDGEINDLRQRNTDLERRLLALETQMERPTEKQP